MRDSLKMIRTTAVVAAVVGMGIAGTGCETRPRKEIALPEKVTKEDALPGFTPEECYFVVPEPEDYHGLDGGIGGAHAAVSNSANGQGPPKVVKCHHHDTGQAAVLCRDDSGQDHPIEWCEQQKKLRATRVEDHP